MLFPYCQIVSNSQIITFSFRVKPFFCQILSFSDCNSFPSSHIVIILIIKFLVQFYLFSSLLDCNLFAYSQIVTFFKRFPPVPCLLVSFVNLRLIYEPSHRNQMNQPLLLLLSFPMQCQQSPFCGREHFIPPHLFTLNARHAKGHVIRHAKQDFSQEKNKNLKQFQCAMAFSNGGIMRPKASQWIFHVWL